MIDEHNFFQVVVLVLVPLMVWVVDSFLERLEKKSIDERKKS